MNDIEQVLGDHLRARAAAIRPTARLDDVHAGRESAALPGRSASTRVARSVVRPAWLGVAAGAVAMAGAGAFAIAVRSPDESAASPTAPVGALPVTPGPTINDHWHEAIGFHVCGAWLPDLVGALETAGEPGMQQYITTGLHSHDDGVIHIHPFGSGGSGDNATLGTFLEGYGVGLDDAGLSLPPEQGGVVVGATCDGQPAEVSVVVWPDAADPDSFVTITDDLRSVPLRDGAALTVAIDVPGTPVPQPPSAADLDALGAADSGATADS